MAMTPALWTLPFSPTSTTLLLSLLLLLANLGLSNAFLTPFDPTHSFVAIRHDPNDDDHTTTRLSLSSDDDLDDSFSSSSSFDVEAARRRLEHLMENDEHTSHGGTPSPPKPQKTTASSSPKETSGQSLFNLSFLFPKPSSSPPTTRSLFSEPPNPPVRDEEPQDDDNRLATCIHSVDISALEAPLRVALNHSAATWVPLTAMERERREMEMELLKELEYGDDTTEELWNMWYQERGVPAGQQLMKMEQGTASPATWGDAEEALRNLILQHGVAWVEPLNRLATLYYMQGRMRESQQLCQVVLHYKPWHFGALSGIVMVHAALQDTAGARKWAARRLPSSAMADHTNRRRQVWVQTALAEAQARLEERQKQGASWWGPSDQVANDDDSDKNDDDDAWQ
eukprot:CAMPEP_0172472194 /NCGR_PEP_ID=MMETSP1065-20121228/68210_1 /TAXON_ID=265537 /ORGANISM="Amphiprora paludosa, Strain CCMP125" /LENGTH=397 /DNA_ID=CAMNT_0013230323 /DNA_START=234 /DNA_END=1427 /DNA_ORIENTATION=+